MFTQFYQLSYQGLFLYITRNPTKRQKFLLAGKYTNESDSPISEFCSDEPCEFCLVLFERRIGGSLRVGPKLVCLTLAIWRRTGFGMIAIVKLIHAVSLYPIWGSQ